MQSTDTKDRISAMEEAFKLAEGAPMNVPAAIQQVIVDERPQGAIKVAQKRDLQEVMVNIRKVATAAGDDFFYSWPVQVKDKQTGKMRTDYVEGASVKCANAVSRIFGNCHVKVRVFDLGPHWIFYAQFYDMETGYVYERPFQQRKNQNVGGKMDRDRAQDMVFQIGASKAARNAVNNALSEFTDYAFDVAKEQLVDKIGRNLAKWLERVVTRLDELQVEKARVEAVRGKPMEKWTAPDVARTVAEIQACKDGMAHADEMWPPAEAGQERPKPEDFAKAPESETPAAKGAQNAKPGTPTGTNGQPRPTSASAASARATGNTQAADTAAATTTAAIEAADAVADEAEGGAVAGEREPPEEEEPAPDEELAGEDGSEAEDAAQEAFLAFERAMSPKGEWVIGLEAGTSPAAIDAVSADFRTLLNSNVDLTDEDRQVLWGRWNQMCLEHKRRTTPRSKRR